MRGGREERGSDEGGERSVGREVREERVMREERGRREGGEGGEGGERKEVRGGRR